MKISVKLLILTISLTACSGPSADDSDPCTAFDRADKEMLDLINSIESKFSKDNLFKKRLNMSQVYWIQYRDRHLRALYPEDWDRHYRKKYGKEIFNSCKCQDLTRMTLARIEELKMWVEKGPDNQAKCPSTQNKTEY